MTAPTPVSAYLHSAAMVKAGVFLVAAMSPGLSGSSTWQLPLIVLGLVSLLMAGWRALRETDLAGAGLRHGQPAGLPAGAGGHRLARHHARRPHHGQAAHSLFKSALFMAVGVIDKTTGTRDIRELSGLGRARPALALFFTLAAASMAGLPPFLGFVGKERPSPPSCPRSGCTGCRRWWSRRGSWPGPSSPSPTPRAWSWARSAPRGSLPTGPARRSPTSATRGALPSVPALLAVTGLVLGLWSEPVDELISRYVDTAFRC